MPQRCMSSCAPGKCTHGAGCCLRLCEVRLVARRQAGLACLFLKISKSLLPGIQRLLLGIDFRLLLAAVVGKFGLVAQHGACVGIVGCGAETSLALGYIEFALQQSYLLFLLADLLL